MYLIIWDDGSASSYVEDKLTPRLLEANENGDVCICRYHMSRGFQRLDDDNETWSPFDDFSMSAMFMSQFENGDDTEDDEEFVEDGSVDIDPTDLPGGGGGR